jgi:sigma-B regulation protein RsbU (phosphoserine phosphatase)
MSPTATKSGSAEGSQLVRAQSKSSIFQDVLGTPESVVQFFLELADPLTSTLDLDTLLARIAEIVRKVIPYEIFAILLLNEKTQELRMRFQIGHEPHIQKMRIKVGEGIVGQAVEKRDAVLVGDVTREDNYINARPDVRSELAIPLIAKNKAVGVIDLQSAQINYFREEHKKLLSLLASRLGADIENARLYTRMSRQARTLQVLNEISRELTSILNLDQLLKRIGDLLSRVIDFQMFSILLLDQTGTKLQHRFSMRFKESIQLKHDIKVGRGLVGGAAESKQTILVPDVTKDPRYIEVNPETRSELCVPLLYKDVVIGVLDLEHTRKNYFNDENTQTVVTLAAQVAIAIENARLYERIAREEKRLERDLAMAREVQMRLLPPSCPKMPNTDIAAKYSPAHAIGGDMYDFVPYGGGAVGIAVGDVSGKGAPAALFAALVGGMLRSMSAVEPSPAEMLTAINEALNERQIESQFMSLLYAVWDEPNRTMQISSSGQPQPIYCHRGKTQVVQATGLPLGLFSDAEYDEVTLHAHPGDVFVFFSDGITDAVNHHDQQFGRHRLEEIVMRNCGKTADELVTAIFQGVTEFSAGVRAFDDETVVVVKVREHEVSVAPVKKTRRTTKALRDV